MPKVGLLVETCWLKKGHICIKGMAIGDFLFFENQPTCFNEKLCVQKGQFFVLQ
jgi:hypothetical protein